MKVIPFLLGAAALSTLWFLTREPWQEHESDSSRGCDDDLNVIRFRDQIRNALITAYDIKDGLGQVNGDLILQLAYLTPPGTQLVFNFRKVHERGVLGVVSLTAIRDNTTWNNCVVDSLTWDASQDYRNNLPKKLEDMIATGVRLQGINRE